MRRSFQVLAIAALTAASTAAAQNPPPGQGMPPMGAGGRGGPGALVGERGAQMLLARSAELDLTDAQVVKLAGIARRSEARHRTMRAAMDSARAKFSGPGDSVARRQFGVKMQSDMTKERDQARVDLRDAIAALTPDQQAKAWEMNAARGAMRGGMRGGMGARGGPRGFGRGDRVPGGMGRGGRMGPGQMGPDQGPANRMGPGGGMPGMRRGGATAPRGPRPPSDDFPGAGNPE